MIGTDRLGRQFGPTASKELLTLKRGYELITS